MAVVPGELQVGTSLEHLDTTLVETGAKNSPTHREGVFIGDPETGDNRARVEQDADGTNGRLAVVASLRDRLGHQVKISQKGEMLTGGMIDDVDVNFQYVIRSAETVATATGTGAISHPGASGAYAQLSPGTGVGKAQLVSKDPVRYRGGHEVYCEVSAIFRTPEANLNQLAGFLNDDDRLCVAYSGTSFGIAYREGGNDTFVAQSAFNFDKMDGTGPSGYTIDPEKINVYRLSYVWHGGLPLAVEVAVNGQWWPAHVFDFGNQIAETHLENPHLPIGLLVERTAGTGTADNAKTGSWRGGSIGTALSESSDDWTGASALDISLLTGTGTKTNLITFHNPATWQGKQNHIVYELAVVTFRSSGNKDLAILGLTNATLGGSPGAVNFIDESNYALQTQLGGSVTGGTGGPATILGPGERERIFVKDTAIKVYPGDTFTIAADPGAGNSVNGTFSLATRWVHGA